MVAADGVCDVDFEQAAIDSHDVLEREYLVLLACGRLEPGLHHAQRLHGCFAHRLDVFRVFELLDLLGDCEVETGHLLAVRGLVHLLLHELTGKARLDALAPEQLVRTDGDDWVLLDGVPLERVLVVPAVVLGVVADELVGGAHAPGVGLGHVDVVEDEGHLHVGVDVDQVRAHLHEHGRERAVQLGAGLAVRQLEVVRLLGLREDFQTLRDGQGLGVGARTDNEQVVALVFVASEVQVLEEFAVVGEVAVGGQSDVGHVEQVLDVQRR